MATRTCLKRSSFGDIFSETTDRATRTVRELGTARFGCRWLARRLARREARALSRLDGLAGIPKLIALEPGRLIRSFVPGQPMQEFKPRSREYFRSALRLVRRLHRHGIAHNDLAKEANWICRSEREAGIVDFQLAICFDRRNDSFRLLAREDLRHLVKHKAQYCPEALTQRERALLADPAWPARCWRRGFKPGYLWLTRRVLGWPERTGADERQRPTAGPKG